MRHWLMKLIWKMLKFSKNKIVIGVLLIGDIYLPRWLIKTNLLSESGIVIKTIWKNELIIRIKTNRLNELSSRSKPSHANESL